MAKLGFARLVASLALLSTACSVQPDQPNLGRVESALPSYRWDNAWSPVAGWYWWGSFAPVATPAVWTNGAETHLFAFFGDGSAMVHGLWNGTSWQWDASNMGLGPSLIARPGTASAVVLVGDTFEVYYVDVSHNLRRAKYSRSKAFWISGGETNLNAELVTTNVLGVAATTFRWFVPGAVYGHFVDRTDLILLRWSGPGSPLPYQPAGLVEQWTRVGTDPWDSGYFDSGATSVPTAVSWGRGRIDVAYRKDKGSAFPGVSRIAHRSWSVDACPNPTNRCWSNTDYVDVDATAAPAIASSSAGNLALVTTSNAGVEVRFGNGTSWAAPTKIADCVHDNPLRTASPVDASELTLRMAPAAAGASGIYQVVAFGTDNVTYATMYRNGEPAALGLQPPCHSCRTEGAACCAGSTCDAGYLCKATGTCTSCGALSQTCCPGALCNGGATCGTDNVCHTPCGKLTQACCGGTSCDSGLRCQSGACATPCGRTGEACCSSSCDAGNVCKSGTCSACGGIGQQCCAGASCSGSALCDSTNTCTDTMHFAPVYNMLASCGAYCHKSTVTYMKAPPFYIAGDPTNTLKNLKDTFKLVLATHNTSLLWTDLDTMKMPQGTTTPYPPADLAIIGAWIDHGSPL